MGTDIHFIVERNVADDGDTPRWVGVYSTGWTPTLGIERDEPLFNQICEERLKDLDSRTPTLPPSYELRPAMKDRHYQFFNKLAGVRGDDGPDPIGVPDDASELTRAELESWGGDAHSESHMPIFDFMLAFLKSRNEKPLDLHHAQVLKGTSPEDTTPMTWCFGAYLDNPENYRVVFWFDN